MFSFLLKKAASFVLPNKLVIVLSLLLTASGYLLVNSYKTNGQQSQKLQLFEQSNQALEQAYNNRLEDIKRLQAKIIDRQEKQTKIDLNLKQFRHDLAGFNDETDCLDIDLGDEFSKLLNSSTSSSD